MLQFICPYCRAVLSVASSYLGMRGRCNKCGGRIALIGNAHVTSPQTASAIADEIIEDGSGPAPQKPTDKQREFLRGLGAADDRIEQLNREQASALIDELKDRRQRIEAPTEKQWGHLKRLGATQRQLANVHNKADAAALIEELHLLPTANQMAYLKELGATGAQLAALKTRAAASSLIDEFLETRQAPN